MSPSKGGARNAFSGTHDRTEPHSGFRIPHSELKVLSAEFVTSAAASPADVIPRDAPQIALAGRSNVGKSSLINALCRAKIARTSAAPGKTRLVNVYRVSIAGGRPGPAAWTVYLIDLPGYGYARRSRASQRSEDASKELAAVAQMYFATRASGLGARDSSVGLRGSFDSEGSRGPRTPDPGSRHAAQRNSAALLLIDARHPGLQSDIDAAAWLDGLGIETRVVATKVDKLSRAERTRNLKTLETMFDTAVLPVSAVSGEGLDTLWKTIATLAGTR